MQEWGRIITAMVTPLEKDGKISIPGIGSLAKRLAAEGSSALLVAGTTGESPTLSDEEKIELFAAVKEAVKIPVIANVGSNNTEKSVQLAEKARKTGVDGVMAVVPYYNKPNKAGQIAHFKAIAAAAGLPVMMYNVPGRTGTNMSGDTILELAQISNIRCLKEATDDFEKISHILREAPPHFTLYTGEDLLTLPALAIGAYGVVSVASHVAGLKMQAMIEHYLAGRVEEAQKCHLQLAPLYKSLFATTSPIPVKAALKLTGFDAGSLRLPLVEADEAIVARLQADLPEARN